MTRASVAYLDANGRLVPGEWIVPQVGTSRFVRRSSAEKIAGQIAGPGACFDGKVEEEDSRTRPGHKAYQVYIRSNGRIEGLVK